MTDVPAEDYDDLITDAALEEEEYETEEEINDEFEELRAKLQETEQHALRTLAEFQTFRRRAHQEKEELRKTASEEVILRLLPVLDNFERTTQFAQQGASFESLLEGVQLIEKQFKAVLGSQGLMPIPSVGQPFDENLHEAIGTEPSTEYPSGTVTMEIEPGYRLGDKVIRPAKVRVAQ